MASIKYGCLHPSPKTIMMPVAASQYFYHNGVCAVNVDTSGHLTVLETADTTVFGIAIPPKGRGNTTNTSDLYWMSSATAAADKIPVILVTSGYSFLLPSGATVTEAMKGLACDIIAANSATASYVDTANADTNIFVIQDLGVNVCDNASISDIVVKLNKNVIQADT